MYDLSMHKENAAAIDGFERNSSKSGFFMFRSPVDKRTVRVIASASHGWDHVSVSRADRCPVWEEMEWIRRKFFRPEEFAFQYHAPIADYVDGSKFSNCVTCLHLWRPWESGGFTVPPKWMVGGMTEDEGEFQMRMWKADRKQKGLPL